jgi:hypothetical protein
MQKKTLRTRSPRTARTRGLSGARPGWLYGLAFVVLASTPGCGNDDSAVDSGQPGLGATETPGPSSSAPTEDVAVGPSSTGTPTGSTKPNASAMAPGGARPQSPGGSPGGSAPDATGSATPAGGAIGVGGAAGARAAAGSGQGGSVGVGTGGVAAGAGDGSGAVGGNVGAEDSVGGSAAAGGSGGTGPACPKPEGEICHEFFANDNSLHEIIYVNEFDPSKNWTQRTQDTASGNSPRQLEVVENPMASDGRAILVSVESGYEEYDYVDHTLIGSVNLGAVSVRGAQRLPDGNTVLGLGDAKLRVVSPEGQTVGSECDLPGSGSDTLRVLTRDAESGDIYFGRGVEVFAVTLDCQEQWSATFPDASSKAYRVLARQGGGAWAATGYPATVVELDAQGQVVSEVGGLDSFPGVLDFSSGFDLALSGNIVIANWWGHVSPPPQQGPHVVELDSNNQIVWRWGTQAEATQITNVLLVR